jgi:hypothetical protein
MAWSKAKSVITIVGTMLLATVTTIAIVETVAPDDGATAGPPVNMTIQWTVGKKYKMRLEMYRANTPGTKTMESDLAQDYNISVLKALDGGGRQMELEFGNGVLDPSPGGKRGARFDPTESLPEDTNQVAGATLNGARIQYFTDMNGKAEKFEDVDESVQRAAGTRKPAQQEFLKSVLNEMLSGKTLDLYTDFGEIMPNRMVRAGKSWSAKKDIIMTDEDDDLTVDLKYTFTNWEQHEGRKCAHIEGAGGFSDGYTTDAGVKVEVANGKISSEVWYDPELGMITDENDEQSWTLKYTYQGKTSTMPNIQNVRVTLLDAQ